MKYAPAGRRGVGVGLAHDLYRAGPASFFSTCNDEITVIVQLETAKGFAKLDEILSVPGIDVAWLGLYDLSVSLGVPLQWEHPSLLDATDRFIACCQRHGVAMGVIAATPEETTTWKNRGFRMISLSVDIAIYPQAVKHFRSALT